MKMFSVKDITLGQFVDTRSCIHRLDPRTKLVGVLLFMMAIFVTHNVFFLIAIGLGCLAVILLAKLPIIMVMKNLRPFLFLFGITFCIHLFFTSGISLPQFPIRGVNVTYEGLEKGIFFTYRLAVLIVAAALFTLTTSPTELTDGLERILKPLKRLRVPTHELSMIMTIALRFIPTFIEEAERLGKAQRVRGVSFSGGVLKRVRALIPLLVPLFLSAFRRADELAAAMDARCYRGGIGRTHFRELRFVRRDYVALTATGITCLCGFIIK